MNEETPNETIEETETVETAEVNEELQARRLELLTNYKKFLTTIPAKQRVYLPGITVLTLGIDGDEARKALNAQDAAHRSRSGENEPYTKESGGLACTAGDLLNYFADELAEIDLEVNQPEEVERQLPAYLRGQS